MHPTKILLTGVSGQVGHALQANISAEFDLVALARDMLDLSNENQIRDVVHKIKPDLIINPAAYTAVDKAESEPELAYAINAKAPQVLAEEAAKLGAAIIHFSTDYVYDGKKNSPYVETDEVRPLGVYGKSKLAGEDAIRAVGLPHLVLRTSWVYGPYGRNFLKTILRLAAERDSLRVVADQFGTPTSALDIADTLINLIQVWWPERSGQTGVFHFTSAGSTSWHGFACEILREYYKLEDAPILKARSEDVAVITTAEYPTPATRPANSCMDNAKLKQVFNLKLPSWQQGLTRVMREIDV